MTKTDAGRAGVAPSRERCGLCGRTAPLRKATRDDTELCEDCWADYEAYCDDEEADWQRQDRSDALAPWLRAVRRVTLNRHRPI